MEFGTYIGTTDVLDASSVKFYDAAGALLDTQSLVIEHPIWAWHGWQSDTPLGKVEFQGATVPGTPLVFDDMQASVPEPAALALLVLGAAAMRRRR
jgi:MYXO-CTERM domain-containing protein